MKYLKIVLFPSPFPTVIAFHRVKKSPMIIGIVDRIKMNSEQVFPLSESELSHTFCPYFLQKCRYNLRLFRLFRGDFPGTDKSSAAKGFFYFFYFIQWCCEKGAKSYVAKKISGRERRSRDETGNQGVEDFRFTIILQLFFNYFTLIIIFFYTFFCPRHLFTPTFTPIYSHPLLKTSIHYPASSLDPLSARSLEKSGRENAGRECEPWSWLWVNVVGKKETFSIKNKNKKIKN